MAVYGSITELIGNTPVVDVSQLSPNARVKIFAKLEGMNPAGSVKDRIALAMIDDAEEQGRTHNGQHGRAAVLVRGRGACICRHGQPDSLDRFKRVR